MLTNMSNDTISFKHISLQCLFVCSFLYPHLTTHHSNIIVWFRKRNLGRFVYLNPLFFLSLYLPSYPMHSLRIFLSLICSVFMCIEVLVSSNVKIGFYNEKLGHARAMKCLVLAMECKEIFHQQTLIIQWLSTLATLISNLHQTSSHRLVWATMRTFPRNWYGWMSWFMLIWM